MAPTRKAAVKKDSITATLKYDKSTPGTHVFKSDEEGSPIPTLYVKKAGFPNGNPEAITVTVEVV